MSREAAMERAEYILNVFRVDHLGLGYLADALLAVQAETARECEAERDQLRAAVQAMLDEPDSHNLAVLKAVME